MPTENAAVKVENPVHEDAVDSFHPLVDLADRSVSSLANFAKGQDTSSAHLSSAQFKDGSIVFAAAEQPLSNNVMKMAMAGQPDDGCQCRVDPMTLIETCGE